VVGMMAVPGSRLGEGLPGRNREEDKRKGKDKAGHDPARGRPAAPGIVPKLGVQDTAQPLTQNVSAGEAGRNVGSGKIISPHFNQGGGQNGR
jgi:hypothetical protein